MFSRIYTGEETSVFLKGRKGEKNGQIRKHKNRWRHKRNSGDSCRGNNQDEEKRENEIMSENEIDQSIKDNAVGPKSAESDGHKVEQHSIKDQIEADRYLSSKEAVKKKNMGIRFGKFVPPGGA